MPTSPTSATLGSIRISPNGRCFVTRDGRPFFWLGDTQWELFRCFPMADVQAICEDRRRKGFSVLQVMLIGVSDGTKANLSEEKPWINDDPLTPNEHYFQGVDEAVRIAADCGLVLAVGVYHQLQAARLTAKDTRAWASWVAGRYRDAPNLIWSMYPKAQPEFVEVCRELAAGLREGDRGAHLITCHPDPSPASSSFIHAEPWLSFNCIQTWARTDLIVPMVQHDYNLRPTKPVVMAEGAYEAGPEYGFEVTPLWVRRQAWWTYLAGGHHSYGHNHSWRLPATWRDGLSAPGASQLGILRQLLEGQREWWSLIPDPTLIAACESGDAALNLCGRHPEGRWGLVYLGGPAEVSVRMAQVAGGSSVKGSWVGPANGERLQIGSFPPRGLQRFASPEGWEDAVLLLEAG